MGLGQRIVAHSNNPFIKGNFSLAAEGISRGRLNKPVSLVFKVYPFGLGNDANQSLTLEVTVVCRSNDLRPIARLSLEMTLSMDGKLISTRSWTKLLKTFWIHDFLPHEIITHSHSKTLDLVIHAFIISRGSGHTLPEASPAHKQEAPSTRPQLHTQISDSDEGNHDI